MAFAADESPPARRVTGLGIAETLRRRAPAGVSVRDGFSIAVIVLLIGVAAGLTYVAGGAPNVVVHFFYVPIFMAASRFQWRGALATAVGAGIVAGPLMPPSVEGGTTQSIAEWGLRLVAFVAIGLLVASLTKESARSISAIVVDARASRTLRLALARRELLPHFQPMVDLQTNQFVGFEALCRWQDPTRGLVPPSEFIPQAERSGIVVAIDTLMLDEATLQTAAWHAAGTRDLVIAVNVSANHVCHPDFVRHITSALHRSGLKPANLCVEITETAILFDRSTALANITQIHELGVLLSLDDFGTGQSSLAYLQEFPIDVIKIDQSFVSRVDVDPKCAALVSAIIQMAQALGATTVAEGIERPTQLEVLRELGCTQGQGYFLGRPGPAVQAGSHALLPLER